MSDTSKPDGQTEEAAKDKAKRITAADNRETDAKQAALDAQASQVAATASAPTPRRRGRSDPRKNPDATSFKILYNAVGAHQQGSVVSREELGADDKSIHNLLSMGAIEAHIDDEE